LQSMAPAASVNVAAGGASDGQPRSTDQQTIAPAGLPSPRSTSAKPGWFPGGSLQGREWSTAGLLGRAVQSLIHALLFRGLIPTRP
jgi:hypothetical protein